MPLAHPLQPLELVQDPIDLTAQLSLGPYQTIRQLLAWYDRGGRLELKPSHVIHHQRLIQLCENLDFTIDLTRPCFS